MASVTTPRTRPRSTARLLLVAFVLLALPFRFVANRDPHEAQAVSSVGLWDRFEASVANAKSYADPYSDVTLDVTYTRPDGSQVAFWGFHDGGTTWRIRFMPDQIGTWRYEARFSDGQPGISGTFSCVGSNLPGMLAQDNTNPLWFGFTGGEHVLIRSFHVGDRFFATNWSASSRTAFLDWAQGQRYNTLSIASHYLNRTTNGRGAGWDTPDLWPLDAAEYSELETILSDLARRQIMVFPFAGFFGRDTNFPGTQDDQSRYIEYTLARLGPYWNILLNVAGPEPNVDGYLNSGDVARLGTEIQSQDIFGHPLSVHNAPGDDPYRDSSWSSYGTLQGPRTTTSAAMSSFLLRNHHPSKPLYAQETLWSGNQNQPPYSDSDIRKLAYTINMSAAALNFGDMNGHSSSGFSGSMDLSQRNQARHDIVKKVWDFFEAVPFYRMKPCQSLISTGFCLAEVGREYLVYLDTRRPVDVAVTGGPFAVQWINAQDTADIRSGGTTTSGQDLTPPAAGDDWILRLTAGAGTVQTPTATQMPAATPAQSTAMTLLPVADTYVQHSLPNTNFGTAMAVKVDSSPIQIGYMRFDLSPLDGMSIAMATLRLTVTNSSERTQTFKYTSDGWDERVLTYANRPTHGAQFASNAGGDAGSVREVDVSIGVKAEQGDLFSFAIENSEDDSFDFSARERASNKPELVVTFVQPTPTPALDPTNTATATAMPTQPATPVPTASASGQAVIAFMLLDAKTGAEIGPLTDGATLNLATLPTRSLTVRANTDPATVGSVVFGYDDNDGYRVENNRPYALAGNVGTDYNSWTPTVGTHTISATPYTERSALGMAGITLTVHFTVVDEPTSEPAAVETSAPSGPVLFSDGFESGNLEQWTRTRGLVVQRDEVALGAYAARATSSGEAAYASRQLDISQVELYYRVKFKVIDRPDAVYLLWLRSAGEDPLVGVYVDRDGRLGGHNYATHTTTTSAVSVSAGEWHAVEVYVRVAGPASTTAVWLDGVAVTELATRTDLGAAEIGQVQIGDTGSGRRYDVAFDEVAVGSSCLGACPAVRIRDETAEPTPTMPPTTTVTPTPTLAAPTLTPADALSPTAVPTPQEPEAPTATPSPEPTAVPTQEPTTTPSPPPTPESSEEGSELD